MRVALPMSIIILFILLGLVTVVQSVPMFPHQNRLGSHGASSGSSHPEAHSDFLYNMDQTSLVDNHDQQSSSYLWDYPIDNDSLQLKDFNLLAGQQVHVHHGINVHDPPFINQNGLEDTFGPHDSFGVSQLSSNWIDDGTLTSVPPTSYGQHMPLADYSSSGAQHKHTHLDNQFHVGRYHEAGTSSTSIPNQHLSFPSSSLSDHNGSFPISDNSPTIQKAPLMINGRHRLPLSEINSRSDRLNTFKWQQYYHQEELIKIYEDTFIWTELPMTTSRKFFTMLNLDLERQPLLIPLILDGNKNLIKQVAISAGPSHRWSSDHPYRPARNKVTKKRYIEWILDVQKRGRLEDSNH